MITTCFACTLLLINQYVIIANKSTVTMSCKTVVQLAIENCRTVPINLQAHMPHNVWCL